MGTSIGRSQNGPVSDPNVVPLIDVLLVLIIIFMAIAPRVTTGLPALIPQPALPQPQPANPDPGTIVVQVMQGGKLKINDEQSDWNALGLRPSEIFKTRGDRVAFVKGAKEVSFAQVARAIDIMRGVGIDHVGLITPAGTAED